MYIVQCCARIRILYCTVSKRLAVGTLNDLSDAADCREMIGIDINAYDERIIIVVRSLLTLGFIADK